MPIQNYSVLAGTVASTLDSAAAQLKDQSPKPHYHVMVNAGGNSYRAAINVLSDDSPPDLQVYMNDNYLHPILAQVRTIGPGLRALASAPGTGALDFVQESLFDFSQMTVLPPMQASNGRDLDDILNQRFGRAQSTAGATVYFFGASFADPGQSDAYFRFQPEIGVHDIHMNQDSIDNFAPENGPYQDGGIFIYYPDKNTWTALFMKFQSQIVPAG